jgi:hypothetical protein
MTIATTIDSIVEMSIGITIAITTETITTDSLDSIWHGAGVV